jgi:2-hydroxychromene-2-carboxylate isomerase
MSTSLAPLPGGPYDVEFFFDPGCPFAWQASVWLRRVSQLREVRIGWRFISLRLINEGKERSTDLAEAHERGHRYLRVCAAAREQLGNDAVGALYKAWGERYWYVDAEGEYGERMAAGAREAAPAEIVAALGLPAALLDAQDDASCDGLIRAETEEAFRRTGDGVGTPIITYDPPHGSSLFGPVLSEVPDDEQAVAFYDALRTFADFPGFSELKRTQRPPLDLPLLAG